MSQSGKRKKPPYPLIWYGGRLFRPLKTEGASETSGDTIFKYEQNGDHVTATYSGGNIAFGHLIARVQLDGSLDMRYHHRNKSNELMTGICTSVPEILPNGKLRLHETWQWTCRDHSHGTSILEEF